VLDASIARMQAIYDWLNGAGRERYADVVSHN
jgi:hypothetical protein